MTYLQLSQIRTDGGTQARAGLDQTTINEYAEAMTGGAQFPPAEVYNDGEVYWLSDGFHRIAAARQNGYENFMCLVRQGTRRDAVLAACAANSKHGLRRSAEDKRRAVETLLRDEEWGKLADREIARRCHVSHPFVAKVRQELIDTGNVTSMERVYIHPKTGEETTMDVSNIGRSHELPELTCVGQVRHWMRYQGRSADDLVKMVDRPGTCPGYWASLIRIRPDGKTGEDMEAAVLQVLTEDFNIERERVNHKQPDTRPNLQVFAAVKQLRDRGFVVVGLPAEEGPLRYSIDDSDWLEPAQVWDFLQNVLNEEQTAVPDHETRRQTWIKSSSSMIDICRAYAKERDWVPESEGQNHADFKLVAYLHDPHGAKRGRAAMLKALNVMSHEEVATQALGEYYHEYTNDSIANVRRWLNQTMGKEQYQQVSDALQKAADRWKEYEAQAETAVPEPSSPSGDQPDDIPYADYLDAQIKATDAEMEQLLADGLPERESLAILDDEPLEISTIDNGLKQIEWLITELLANVRGAGYISVLGKLAEANMAILDARKILKEVAK